jgi:sugar lactone lactonase YvrE
MMNIILRFLIFLVLVAALVVGGLRLYFGGGAPYKDLSSAPLVGEPGLSSVLEHPDPIGSVAVSADGRLFFTAHEDGRPEGPQLFEWRNGKAVPFPSEQTQAILFETPSGITIDRRNRLWVIDPANHGLGRPRIVAIDLDSGLVVHEHVFPREIAPRGSLLHQLQVDPDGRMIYIADVGFLRKSPALVVYDSVTRSSRRLLENHGSLRAQDWLIRTPVRDMRFVGGLVPLKPGLHGIALDPTGQWLHFAAMAHDTLYRVPTGALLDDQLTDSELGEQVEAIGSKPLSDGLAADLAGNVYIADVEHGAVMRMAPDGRLTTLVRSPRIRWAESLWFDPDGWLYVSDSAMPEVLMQSRTQIKERGPYHVFRFSPTGAAQQ